MSKKLAILGHETRNEEVIELLKMLGGMDTFGFSCKKTDRFYHVSPNDGYVYWDYNDPSIVENKFEVFTLEKFLEKFPFKVGDFVRIPEYETDIFIHKMKWCPVSKHIEYLVCPNDEEEWYTADELLEYNVNPNKTRSCKKCGLHFGSVRSFDIDCPHNTPKSYAVGLKDGKVIDCKVNKEADMNKNNGEVINMTKEIITPAPDITANITDKNNCDIECPDGYEFYDVNGNLIGNKVMMRPKKPKYPTTYSDCCEIHMGKTNFSEFTLAPIKYSHTTKFDNSVSYDAPHIELFNNLYKIVIYQNAYWKIAGEELKLGKPWKPDWDNLSTNHEFIKFNKGCFTYSSRILVFPTEEMRDAFYKNFRDLIEGCKELL